MHPNPKHQQHDADFGKLRGKAHVPDITRGERADRDAGEQIADDRRHAQPDRGKTPGEGQRQPDRDRRD